MPSIVCDEEEVTFTGDIPASPGQVYEMLMGLSVSRAEQL